jgi:hypothetical protein
MWRNYFAPSFVWVLKGIFFFGGRRELKALENKEARKFWPDKSGQKKKIVSETCHTGNRMYQYNEQYVVQATDGIIK